MLKYATSRLLTFIPTFIGVTLISFGFIRVLPGDPIIVMAGERGLTDERYAELSAQFGFDRPILAQFWEYLLGVLQGDLGWSFELDQQVAEILGETAWLTIAVNFSSLLFVYAVALPLGTIAAVRANSWIDYGASLIGYIGLATPNFLLAIILLFYGAQYLDIPIGGLMAREYEGEPMSWGKAMSILTHLIVPTIVIGTSAAAVVMRRLRANLMDELNKPYVETARAKGVPPVMRTIKYPLRMSLNPFVSDIGNMMPQLVSGSVMISVVMSLPTLGPILLQALKSQDIYLSGFILLFVSALTLVGMLISDILLAVLDPRIRLGGRRKSA